MGNHGGSLWWGDALGDPWGSPASGRSSQPSESTGRLTIVLFFLLWSPRGVPLGTPGVPPGGFSRSPPGGGGDGCKITWFPKKNSLNPMRDHLGDPLGVLHVKGVASGRSRPATRRDGGGERGIGCGGAGGGIRAPPAGGWGGRGGPHILVEA